MSKDTVRFDAFVAELRALEVRHGLHIGASGYYGMLYIDEGARGDSIENWIELPPPPIPGDVPHEVITAVFHNHVQHRELPEHWLETVLRTHWGEGSRAIYRADFQHRETIRKMMGQVTSFADKGFEAKTLAIGASCEGPAHWAAFLTQPTEWFDASTVRPYHVGAYQVATPGGDFSYSLWDVCSSFFRGLLRKP